MQDWRGRKDRGETEDGAIGVSLENLRVRGSGQMTGEDGGAGRGDGKCLFFFEHLSCALDILYMPFTESSDRL